LINAGLDELVCDDVNQYINIVKQLSSNPSQIDQYKKTVGDKFKKSMNVHEFMGSYENILKDLHNKRIENDVFDDNIIDIRI